MTYKKTLFSLALLTCLQIFVFSQGTTDLTTKEVVKTDSTKTEVEKAVPNGFRTITLGMKLEEVKTALLNDKMYAYQGDSDVSMLPRDKETLIEVAGLSFIKRAYFQFHEDVLFTIILTLNTDKLDYFSLYTSLESKYGKVSSLDPKEAVWENKSIRVSISRPLSIKYLDLSTFNKLKEGSNVKKAQEDIDRSGFLNQF